MREAIEIYKRDDNFNKDGSVKILEQGSSVAVKGNLLGTKLSM